MCGVVHHQRAGRSPVPQGVNMKTVFDENTACLDHLGHCPKCNADWCAGDIFDALRQAGYTDKSDEQLREFVKQCYSPPYKFSRLIGVELPYNHPEHYDGVSYWMCPDCKHQFPRFAGGTGRP